MIISRLKILVHALNLAVLGGVSLVQWYRIGPRGCFVIARRQASVSQRELTAPKWIEVISTESRQGALLDPQGGSAPTYQLLLLLEKKSGCGRGSHRRLDSFQDFFTIHSRHLEIIIL